MAIDLRLRYDRATKERAAAMFAEGLRHASEGEVACRECRDRRFLSAWACRI